MFDCAPEEEKVIEELDTWTARRSALSAMVIYAKSGGNGMLELTESEKETILAKIECFFDELCQKYDERKYNETKYKELCEAFKKPSNVKKDHILNALAWKYGKDVDGIKRNSQYKAVRELFVDGWPAFIEKQSASGDDVFNFWNERSSGQFISVAFLAHLVFPEDIPIVDQHTFRAARFFLGLTHRPQLLSRSPKTLEEIHILKAFVDDFSALKKVSPRQFDKYLMMFGKHVAPR